MPNNSIKYKENYLNSVIFRVDFERRLELEDTIKPTELQKAIIELLPRFKENSAREIFLDVSTNEKTEKTTPIWTFSNKEEDLIVNLTSKNIDIELKNYIDFENYKQKIEIIFNAFQRIYKPLIKRFGLRYINQIHLDEGHPLEWAGFINTSLTSDIDNFIDVKSDISRAMTQIIFNKTDYKVNFQYGIFNPDYPNKISKKDFILDFDCFTENIESDKIFKYLDIFNEEITCLFEKSIEEGLRSEMGKQNELS